MPGERDVAIFLGGLAVLLFSARVLGELARRLRLPAVTGELLAGVLLGPTLLGRVLPGSVGAVFPDGAPRTMLAGYTLLSSVLLLTIAGLEIDLSVVRRRLREAALTSGLGVALPMALGVAFGLALPDRHLVDPQQRLVFAMFVGTALSISAMPVIAKTLVDLGLLRTDLGLLVMGSAMVDDLLGWLLFSLLVGPMRGQALGWGELGMRVLGVAVFVILVLGVGRRLIDRWLEALDAERLSAPGRVLSTIIVATILGASVTEAMGIHALFGAFIVSVGVGASKRLRATTRASIHELVSNIFAPVFFAAVGLRVDFAAHFDLLLVGSVLLVACVAKIVGCAMGARLGGMPTREALSVGFAMNSRGAMEIILASVALEGGLIRPELFVALVVMALATSMLSGPMMSWLLRGRRTEVRSLLEEGAVVTDLRARSPEQAIRELVSALAAGTPLDGATLADAVLDDAGPNGGLADGVALSSARLTGIPRTMIALGLSRAGIDFDASDGVPARIVWVLLIPESERGRAVELQAALVGTVSSAPRREALCAATTREAVLEALQPGEAGRVIP